MNYKIKKKKYTYNKHHKNIKKNNKYHKNTQKKYYRYKKTKRQKGGQESPPTFEASAKLNLSNLFGNTQQQLQSQFQEGTEKIGEQYSKMKEQYGEQASKMKGKIKDRLDGIYRDNKELIDDTYQNFKSAKDRLKDTLSGKSNMFQNITNLNEEDNIINKILSKIPLPFNIEKIIIFLKMIINNGIAYMIQVKELLKKTINDDPNEMAINFIINLTGLFCNQRIIYKNLYDKVKEYFESKMKKGDFLSDFDEFNNNMYSSILEVFENFYKVYDKLCSIRNKLLGITELLKNQSIQKKEQEESVEHEQLTPQEEEKDATTPLEEQQTK